MSEREEIEQLIGRIALRDRAAFSALYARTSAKLFGVILRVLDNRGEAEEVTQDVYIRIWRNAGQYRQNGYSPMTWLITVARNAAIDARRKRGRGAAEGDAMLELIADPAPGPEARAIAQAERVALDHCLAELDAARAQAVARAYLHGESYAELAAHFEVPLNTMRTWLRRSLMALRRCLTR